MRAWWLAAVLVVSGCAADVVDTTETGVDSEALRRNGDCDLVRCPLPLCADGQHLSYRGGCCPVCVGAPSRCATVLCAAVVCGEDEQLVTSPGQCCPHCSPRPPVAECSSDLDCPQYSCIQCPCPVSECRGHQCVTSTPDASTCGGDTF